MTQSWTVAGATSSQQHTSFAASYPWYGAIRMHPLLPWQGVPQVAGL
jgi:hypothetical protein